MYLTKGKKSRFYYVVYHENGRRKTRSTKQILKSDANKFLTQFANELNQKTILPQIKLSEFESEYLSFCSVYSKAHQKSLTTSFRQLKLSIDPRIKLSKINNRMIERFILEVYSRSQSAASLYYRNLKSAFNKAVHWKYLQVNPFENVQRPRVNNSFPEFLNPHEFSNILNFVEEEYLKSFYTVAFNTGMRANELCNLKWNSINLKEKCIHIKNTNSFRTKNRKERVIPINFKVHFELMKFRPKILCMNSDTKDFVFTRIKGIKLPVEFVSKKFKRACRKANVSEAIHLHSLRHSFASQLVQKGVSLYVVKELLGHSDIKTTQIYSHLKLNDLRNAINLI